MRTTQSREHVGFPAQEGVPVEFVRRGGSTREAAMDAVIEEEDAMGGEIRREIGFKGFLIVCIVAAR